MGNGATGSASVGEEANSAGGWDRRVSFKWFWRLAPAPDQVTAHYRWCSLPAAIPFLPTHGDTVLHKLVHLVRPLHGHDDGRSRYTTNAQVNRRHYDS